jgi:DNA-binding CsgD family transcriptional regulator
VVVRSFLSSLVSPEILVKLSDIALLFGIPFLIFAWLMLIRFSGSLSGMKKIKRMILWFLIFNFLVLMVIGYFITGTTVLNTTLTIRIYYVIMNLVYYFLASYLIHLPWKGEPMIHDHDRKIIAPSLFIIMMVQCIPLIFYNDKTWIGVIFIFTFFLGNTFLPVYFSYGTLLASFADGPDKSISFKEFCKRFEVSPRESDVIMEICNGLSNKEISDKLFISLQTVKDHTHHIYIKTNVRSRVQLINLVKDMMN